MYKGKIFHILAAIVILFFFFGCGTIKQMTAAEHQQQLGSTQEREMTLGIVQKEIRVGMAQAEVAQALGSPNIVTKDSEGDETWIYDKIATEASYSHSSKTEGTSVGGGLGVIGLAAKTLILGGVGAGYSSTGAAGAGASATTQKTLTVVVKFDKKGLVKDFTYHTSKF